MIIAKTAMDAMPGSCAECAYGDKYGAVGDVRCRVSGDYFTGNARPPHKERPDGCPLMDVGGIKMQGGNTCPNGCGEMETARGQVADEGQRTYWDVSIGYCPRCMYTGEVNAGL